MTVTPVWICLTKSTSALLTTSPQLLVSPLQRLDSLVLVSSVFMHD